MVIDNENKRICELCNIEKSLSSFSVYGRNEYRRKVCKICVSQQLKIEDTDTAKKICKACGLEKKIKSFGKTSVGNRGNVCNICKASGNTIKKGVKSDSRHVKDNALQLGNPTIKDYINTYEFLESIGYNLSEDIHEQFCKKYNITPNSPKQEFKNYYSKKDCGFI
jgi:hypothetical protein